LEFLTVQEIDVYRYFLGTDIGSTKTHALIADETGKTVGFGKGGPGNHEVVGYGGLAAALDTAVSQALAAAGLAKEQIAGAGFGVAGYDWPSEREPTLRAIGSLGLQAPVEVVNDTTLGLLAGAAEGWGVAVVSGTGCNCRGRDRSRQREGKVTGHGVSMGEAAGASELISKTLQAIAQAWTRRGPPTQLTPVFVEHTGSASIEELLENLTTGKVEVHADAAPLVFQVAAGGDPVAMELVRWAGCELGELACAVIRQLEFEELAFDVVLVGSMFDGGPKLIEPMRETIHALAPGARLVRLTVPPVIGAVLLGMEQGGLPALERREALIDSARKILPG
jgi:N-acetylglucosamine kinase-like BadF-type ATPase